MSEPRGIDEMAMAAWWRDHQAPLVLTDSQGRSYEIVHRGTWSHRLGPDFVDAMVVIDGRELVSGAVELHLRGRGWYEHGHNLDSAYCGVVLHVTLDDDLRPVRLADGRLAPTVRLPATAAELAERRDLAWQAWSIVGGAVCAPTQPPERRQAILEAVASLGDQRFGAKAAQFEAQMALEPPGQIVYRAVLEALGYSQNREPMRLLASVASLSTIESLLAAAPTASRRQEAEAILLGAAGFLPLAPAEAALAGCAPAETIAIETAWSRRCDSWRDRTLPPTAWVQVRTRPANHPVARLRVAAAWLARAETGLLSALLDLVRHNSDPAGTLRDWSGHEGVALGKPRAVAVMANAVLPFALAYASWSGDQALADAASSAWEILPAADVNQVTRRAAHQVFGEAGRWPSRERLMQGLIHLDRTLCQPRRCFDCPVAHLVVEAG